MTALRYDLKRRRWAPVRDTSNPSRDALARGRTTFVMLNLQRDLLRARSLRGYPLARLRMVEAAIRCDVACRAAAAAMRLAVRP